MKEGDVVLTPLPQADGEIKPRPALVLRRLPPFGDLLVCGISTQIRIAVADFDDVIRSSDHDFGGSGLLGDSVLRLGFLAVLPALRIAGSIGEVSPERHQRLLVRLSRFLVQELQPLG
jgi:mRNA interferase MazF